MGIVHVLVNIWNFALSVAPTIFHTACQLVDGATNTIKLGGGG